MYNLNYIRNELKQQTTILVDWQAGENEVSAPDKPFGSIGYLRNLIILVCIVEKKSVFLLFYPTFFLW